MNVSLLSHRISKRLKISDTAVSSQEISDPEALTIIEPRTTTGSIKGTTMGTAAGFEKDFGLFDSVFHEVSTAIIIISNTTKDLPPEIVDINHHFELITGYSSDEIQGQSLYKFLIGTKFEANRHIIERTIENRQAAIFSCPWKNKNGQTLDIDMTIRPFNSHDDGSKFICVLRENKNENNVRNNAAKETKRKLLAAMHHNFKTPLNGILGYSEVIMMEMMGPIGQESYKSYAQDIHGAGKDLLQLIDNLLELKELETTEFRLQEERFSLGGMIAECLKKIFPPADKGKIHLSTNIEPDFPDIFGDKSRLQQVIHSLLTNAVKFTPPSGEILLTATKDKNGAGLIHCQDNGQGMPSQQLAKAFCHDTHLSDIYASPTVGIGFGLSYVKQIIEKHGGTVSIISSVGKGTTVTLYLPAERLC
ncbi:hypothetical protein MNBD_ALPHA03-1508 [hydrothermal vent metagenome]|uniref:histidine kinase n=1 Tax=hydrothermal vent metagenome TaxID=652676 RepID=A0A3B1AN93_9ZZZZ